MRIAEYTVGLARREHVPVLPGIERAAAALFPDDVLTPELRESALPVEQLELAHAERRLWTALTRSGIPVGFAMAVRESDAAWLQEIDVHPAHQRRDLGRRLIQCVIDWARTHALGCVTLTTFEHLPWNAPFYSRLGFRKLAEHELDGELLERLRSERRRGLDQRVAMRLVLGPDPLGAVPNPLDGSIARP
jgi:GNAT superfamily N-acetyltransferase